MRLSELEKTTIIKAVKAEDSSAKIWVFGSRTLDDATGGDIDLLIESSVIRFKEKQRIRLSIQQVLGDQKIDLVVSSNLESNSDPFIKKIIKKALPL